MTAYAAAEQLSPGALLRSADEPSSARLATGPLGGLVDVSAVDALLARLADLVVQRLIERSDANPRTSTDEWMDARSAAEYLGIHRDTLRKLAASRGIPTHQEGSGCKLYFRRDELDEWRQSSRPVRTSARSTLRAIS